MWLVSAISAVSIGAEDERDVVVKRRICHLKHDLVRYRKIRTINQFNQIIAYLNLCIGVEGVIALRGEVSAHSEVHPVVPWGKLIQLKEVQNATIVVCYPIEELFSCADRFSILSHQNIIYFSATNCHDFMLVGSDLMSVGSAKAYSETLTPLAGRPLVVSRMCVVTGPISGWWKVENGW